MEVITIKRKKRNKKNRRDRKENGKDSEEETKVESESLFYNVGEDENRICNKKKKNKRVPYSIQEQQQKFEQLSHHNNNIDDDELSPFVALDQPHYSSFSAHHLRQEPPSSTPSSSTSKRKLLDVGRLSQVPSQKLVLTVKRPRQQEEDEEAIKYDNKHIITEEKRGEDEGSSENLTQFQFIPSSPPNKRGRNEIKNKENHFSSENNEQQQSKATSKRKLVTDEKEEGGILQKKRGKQFFKELEEEEGLEHLILSNQTDSNISSLIPSQKPSTGTNQRDKVKNDPTTTVIAIDVQSPSTSTKHQQQTAMEQRRRSKERLGKDKAVNSLMLRLTQEENKLALGSKLIELVCAAILKPCLDNVEAKKLVNIGQQTLVNILSMLETLGESLSTLAVRNNDEEEEEPEPSSILNNNNTTPPSEAPLPLSPPPPSQSSSSISPPETTIDDDTMLITLKNRFNLDQIKPFQREIVQATLNGSDTFVRRCTGEGKSLCFQLAALLLPGITIVVSPLVALMIDQVSKLRSHNIPCARLSDDVPFKERKNIFAQLELLPPPTGHSDLVKLIYVTPEMLSLSRHLQRVLAKLYDTGRLSLFVFDEVHFLLQCGHNFRPEYKKIGALVRSKFPSVPMMALTASVTSTNEKKLIHRLQINPANLVVSHGPITRSNLRYEIKHKKMDGISSFRDIATLLLSNQNKYADKVGIVYCMTTRDCTKMKDTLISQNIPAAEYHGKMSPEDKHKSLHDWMSNRVRVICATNSLGLGIDKPDVSFVIHHSMPSSIEAFYQETGRAGRDGRDADCILYLSYTDIARNHRIQHQTRLQGQYELVELLDDRITCRKVQLETYFVNNGNSTSTPTSSPFSTLCTNMRNCCDNCSPNGPILVREDMSSFACYVLEFLQSQQRNNSPKGMTIIQLATQIYKKLNKKKPLEEEMTNNNDVDDHQFRSWSLQDIKTLIMQLICVGLISTRLQSHSKGNVYFYLSVSDTKGQEFVSVVTTSRRRRQQQQIVGGIIQASQQEEQDDEDEEMGKQYASSEDDAPCIYFPVSIAQASQSMNKKISTIQTYTEQKYKNILNDCITNLRKIQNLTEQQVQKLSKNTNLTLVQIQNFLVDSDSTLSNKSSSIIATKQNQRFDLSQMVFSVTQKFHNQFQQIRGQQDLIIMRLELTINQSLRQMDIFSNSNDCDE